MKALAKSSASSKRMAVDQGGLGAAGSGQRRKVDKYTLDAALDQPCKFRSTPGREAAHSTRQCSFIKELEQHTQQLPGVLQAQSVEGQEDHRRDLAAEQPDQGDDDFPAVVEEYHVFTTPEKDKRSDLWYKAEVNAIMPAEPHYMHWSEAAITWGREDHPPLMPSLGEYARVLDPIMCSDTHT
jgi:hypothetical protein